MARLRRQWGLQSRWTADGPDAPWSEPWWAPSRGDAEATRDEVLESYQRRLVSRVVSDLIVVVEG